MKIPFLLSLLLPVALSFQFIKPIRPKTTLEAYIGDPKGPHEREDTIAPVFGYKRGVGNWDPKEFYTELVESKYPSGDDWKKKSLLPPKPYAQWLETIPVASNHNYQPAPPAFAPRPMPELPMPTMNDMDALAREWAQRNMDSEY